MHLDLVTEAGEPFKADLVLFDFDKNEMKIINHRLMRKAERLREGQAVRFVFNAEEVDYICIQDFRILKEETSP